MDKRKRIRNLQGLVPFSYNYAPSISAVRLSRAVEVHGRCPPKLSGVRSTARRLGTTSTGRTPVAGLFLYR